ncbi:sulfur carrier protein ThiS [uncultured Victivallis sp.]|uniref:sulfur carrier protein ThiS n=1 Tax=uncultured Victivallis sp. TaxID=354118 RepID=UPI0025F802B1|nr:sulfur carrier protein ThiS [uncultured Victivallis sp.]
MKITFNGTPQEVADGTAVAEFLAGRGFKPAEVVAEINGEILNAEELGRVLGEGDALNAFRVVAGG